jgi:acyl CoA:acetate/3-ketoacid CoA transferase
MSKSRSARQGLQVPVLTGEAAAKLIENGSVITISSSSALGCPDFVLKAIGERFDKESSPKNLTVISPIAAGDMYGVKGIDHISKVGLLSKIIAGSFPSGPSSLEPPLIRQLIANEEIDAYNLPSGVIFQMHRAGAVRQPGVFSKVGMDTFIDPRISGGALNKRTPKEFVRVENFQGEEWLFYPGLTPDVAIVRATSADEHGNLTYEHEASPLGALDQAYATHNHGGIVIAQVKRVVAAGTLDPKYVRVPGILVDAIVVDPDQMQTTMTKYEPTLSGEKFEGITDNDPLSYSLETIIARRAAQELEQGWIVNLGFGISAVIPRALSEKPGHANVTWIIEQGAVGGTPVTGFAFGCAHNPDALMQSTDQFTLLQGGGFNAAMLSFLEVDSHGNVNVSHLPGRTHVTAGVGGFADITLSAPLIIFSGYFTAGKKNIEISGTGLNIKSDGSIAKFVPEVSQITFSGQRALANGQKVYYITERCVIELRKEGLTVVEIAPGVDLQKDILDRAGFPLKVADTLSRTNSSIFDSPEVLV